MTTNLMKSLRTFEAAVQSKNQVDDQHAPVTVTVEELHDSSGRIRRHLKDADFAIKSFISIHNSGGVRVSKFGTAKLETKRKELAELQKGIAVLLGNLIQAYPRD